MQRKCCRGQVHTGFWWGNLRVRDHLEELGKDGRIILKWVLKWNWGIAWTDWSGLGQEEIVDSFKCHNVISGFENAGNFLASCDLLDSEERLCSVALISSLVRQSVSQSVNHSHSLLPSLIHSLLTSLIHSLPPSLPHPPTHSIRISVESLQRWNK